MKVYFKWEGCYSSLTFHESIIPFSTMLPVCATLSSSPWHLANGWTHGHIGEDDSGDDDDHEVRSRPFPTMVFISFC